MGVTSPLVSDTRTKWLVPFLVGYFFATCFTYVFPLMVLLLTDAGFSGSGAAVIQSMGLFLAGFLVTYFGKLLDVGRYRLVLSLSAICISFGLFAFSHSGIPREIVALGALVFIFGASLVNIAVTRVTEGLASSGNLQRASSLTYMTTNSALGVSSLLAYFFIDRYKMALITADFLSTYFPRGRARASFAPAST